MSEFTQYLHDDWLRFASPAALIAHLNAPDIRVAHVFRRLEYLFALHRELPERVVSAGSRLLCGSADHWDKKRLRRAVIGHERYRAKSKSEVFERIAPLPVQMIGHVYFIKSPLRPNNLKIGFTTRTPELRRRALMAGSGEELILLGFFVGTFMDEQILHALNSKRLIAGEWYADPLWLPDLDFLKTETVEGAPTTGDLTFGAPSLAMQ